MLYSSVRSSIKRFALCVALGSSPSFKIVTSVGFTPTRAFNATVISSYNFSSASSLSDAFSTSTRYFVVKSFS